MGGDEEGEPPLGLQPEEEIVDDLARLRIEIARGLVGQDHPRAVHERARDGHALLLAARELARKMPQPVGEARPRAGPRGAEPGPRARATREQGGNHRVLEGRHLAEEVVELEHEADILRR